LILYEATHDPAIAATALCVKFGWEDFRTARWLRRTDPDTRRGKACWWLYFASSLWKVAVSALAMFLLIVVLEHAFDIRQQGRAVDVLALIKGAFLSLLFASLLLVLATVIALVLARRFNVRVWLNGAVGYARRRSEWPPLYGKRNHALILVLTAAVAITFLSLGLLLPLAWFCVKWARRSIRFAERPADCWGEDTGYVLVEDSDYTVVENVDEGV
jgi:hypothetical protein